MLINERTAIRTDRVLLVPYCQHHVMAYHDWMKDPDIRAATASEPLSISEEYDMQKSWRVDTDKLTFILCLAPDDGADLPNHAAEVASMIGDINMFISTQEADDGKPSLVGELELMIASKDFQRKGLGKTTLITFLTYIHHHEKEIVEQFYSCDKLGPPTDKFDYFAVKINESNGRSLLLFEGIGFEKASSVPNYFGEYELRLTGLTTKALDKMLSKHSVQDYRELEYTTVIPVPADGQDGPNIET